jgi:hypothetical protein
VKLLTTIVAACALSGLPSAHAKVSPPEKKVSDEAKAAFIKKCFRDQTKKSCEAPPEARVRN